MAGADVDGQAADAVSGARDTPTIVIILHYRGVADTLACVASVVVQCRDGLDLVVIDNGSTDGIAEALVTAGLQVPVLRLAVNTGWAGGNNAGVTWARERGAELVCLLNNDTVVPPGALDRLIAVACAFGPCLLHPAIDFTDPAEGTQLDASLAPGAKPVAGFSTLYPMNYAYGACLLVAVAVFDRIGVFDERFFLQLEETDFHQRAVRTGIRAVCEVSVRISHAESRSFGGRVTPDKMYYIARNSLLLASKNLRNPRLGSDLIRQLYWSVVAQATKRGNSGERGGCAGGALRWLLSDDEHARAARDGVRDFMFRRFGPRQRR